MNYCSAGYFIPIKGWFRITLFKDQTFIKMKRVPRKPEHPLCIKSNYFKTLLFGDGNLLFIGIQHQTDIIVAAQIFICSYF